MCLQCFQRTRIPGRLLSSLILSTISHVFPTDGNIFVPVQLRLITVGINSVLGQV